MEVPLNVSFISLKGKIWKKPNNTGKAWYNHRIFPNGDEAASNSFAYSLLHDHTYTKVTFFMLTSSFSIVLKKINNKGVGF